MARTRRNTVTRTDRAIVARKNDKIINDFLLQFAYTLTIGVLSIFVYNALGAFRYGMETYNTVKTLMWILFGVSLASGIVLSVLGIIKKKRAFKIPTLYSFATALVAFWYVGVEIIVYYAKEIIPILEKVSGSQKVILCAFPLLGIALVVEFVIYFVRYYSLNKK